MNGTAQWGVRRTHGMAMVLLLLAGLLAAFPTGAGAASYVVTNCNDNGPGSLRMAIGLANQDTAGPHTITFDLSPACDTITLTSEPLYPSRDLIIQGPGASMLAVSGNDVYRVFEVASTSTTVISGLTIRDAKPAGSGGAIRNSGTLTIIDSVIANSSTTIHGGGVYNLGSLTLVGSTIIGNTAQFGGGVYSQGPLIVKSSTINDNEASDFAGGLFVGNATVSISGSSISGNAANDHGGVHNLGTLTISGSTIAGNHAVRGGGGVRNEGKLTITGSTIFQNSSEDVGGISNKATLVVANSVVALNSAPYAGGVLNQGHTTVTNSTISGNTTSGVGGGIRNDAMGILAVTHSTISGNSAASGGGILNAGSLALAASIVAGNSASMSGVDVHGLAAGSYNLIGNGEGSSGLTNGINGNLVGTSGSPIDPLLDSLDINGGPTLTHKLLPNSPAINHIPASACAVTEDQRGLERPQGVGCDIGAFEAFAPVYFQACLFAGSLSQVRQVELMLLLGSCGRGEPVVLRGGGDPAQLSHHACLYGGTLSQVGPSVPGNCGRGAPVSFAIGGSLWGCLYGGALSQVGVNQPSCGRGTPIGFAF